MFKKLLLILLVISTALSCGDSDFRSRNKKKRGGKPQNIEQEKKNKRPKGRTTQITDTNIIIEPTNTYDTGMVDKYDDAMRKIDSLEDANLMLESSSYASSSNGYSYDYPAVAQAVLTKKLEIELKKHKAIPEQFFTQQFRDLHNVSYTQTSIADFIEERIKNTIAYVAKDLVIDYNKLVQGETEYVRRKSKK